MRNPLFWDWYKGLIQISFVSLYKLSIISHNMQTLLNLPQKPAALRFIVQFFYHRSFIEFSNLIRRRSWNCSCFFHVFALFIREAVHDHHEDSTVLCDTLVASFLAVYTWSRRVWINFSLQILKVTDPQTWATGAFWRKKCHRTS